MHKNGTDLDKSRAEKEIAVAKKWRSGGKSRITVPPGLGWLLDGERAKTRDV